MALKFYNSVARELKLKIRKFWEPTTVSGEVIGEKLMGVGEEAFYPLPPS